MKMGIMKKSIITLAAVSASLVFGQQTEVPTISSALEELYGQTEEKLPKEQPAYLKVIKSKIEERSTLIYRCRHVSAKSIMDSVESATSPTGTVETSNEQNMITVNDRNEYIDELKELIISLDTRGSQVLVEAQIVEVQMGDGTEWDAGLNMTYDMRSSAGSLVGGDKGFPDSAGEYPEESGGWFDVFTDPNDWLTINARLRWLNTTDKAEILSSPNLLVDLGTTAMVSTGTDQPLLEVVVNNGVSQESVYYKRTGVNLRVTPQLINNDTVTIEVRPEVTYVVGYAQLSASSEPPIISVRNISTKLNVKDGGIVMMGGLYTSKEIESEDRVPILSSIPYLGHFFRSTSISEEQVQLIFLLKVTIVPDSTGTFLQNADSIQKEVKGAGEILKRSLMEQAAPAAEVEEK
jgi:general secretion pathway protein D